ncbi:hypothetical protein HMPREF1508_0095 [Shuttleworthella sp. MSX8B]|nr:hypothetical protein HMPREF1508_0095 [Shuttleworthia sp. MSX8B]
MIIFWDRFQRVRPESAGEQNRESGSGESAMGSLFGIAGIKRGRIGLSRADMLLQQLRKEEI